MTDGTEYPEWTTEEWTQAWTIHVGRAYRCAKCDTMIMVTKGGVGTLALRVRNSDIETLARSLDRRVEPL